MVCYRHPDREAYVSCQRCGRFICPQCQVESSVGFLCPDCAGGTQRQVTKRRLATTGGLSVTNILIAINVLLWIPEIAGQSQSWWVDYMSNMVLMPANVPFAPWTLITSGFAHDWSSPLHLLVNMYSLYIFGQEVERLLGRWRYIALYLIAVFAGGVSVLLLGNPTSTTVGASGAIFGLMAAYAVFLRTLGQPSGQMLGLIAFNLIFGFFNSGISWQGHVGGLIGGALVAWIYSKTRSAEHQAFQKFALVATVILLGLLAATGIAQLN